MRPLLDKRTIRQGFNFGLGFFLAGLLFSILLIGLQIVFYTLAGFIGLSFLLGPAQAGGPSLNLPVLLAASLLIIAAVIIFLISVIRHLSAPALPPPPPTDPSSSSQ